MPISPVSPAMRIHSWSLVYFRSGGYAMISPAGGPEDPPLHLPLIERQRDDGRARHAPAHVDRQLRAWRREVHWHVGHPDGLLEKRRLRPAGHHTDRLVAAQHRVALPRDAPIDHLEPDELSRASLLL